jgi:uncharacterized protein YeaO (DUF488 family)
MYTEIATAESKKQESFQEFGSRFQEELAEALGDLARDGHTVIDVTVQHNVVSSEFFHQHYFTATIAYQNFDMPRYDSEA